MKISEIIKGLRINKSMTQKELAELIGSSIVSVQCWENGSKKPSADAIVALAKALSVSSDYLLGIRNDIRIDHNISISRDEHSLISDYRLLDRHGKNLVKTVCRLELNRNSAPAEVQYIPRYVTPSAAGRSDPISNGDYEMIPVSPDVARRADFAVKIQGNSMLPNIYDGDIIFVRKTSELRNGDIGIFCVNGSMYCKHFFHCNNGGVELASTNPDFEETNIYIAPDSNYEFRVYGVALIDGKIELPPYNVLP